MQFFTMFEIKELKEDIKLHIEHEQQIMNIQTTLKIYAQCHKRPQSRKLFLMMTSVTASSTNWTLLVSVATVNCV